MEITEEQRKRAESNRLAALAKRKAILESTTCLPIPEHPWRLSKCQKQSPKLTTSFPKQQSLENTYIDPFLKPHFPEKFRARLEIYSPDSFSVTPEPSKGFLYLGETECLRKLRDYLLDVIPLDYTQNQSGGKAILYKLENYDAVWKCLKNSKGIELEEIPRRTLNVLQRLLHSYVTGQWIPCRPEHLSDEEVDKLIGEMPKTLFDALLPFQIDGLRFGLQRGGRCLIADEMGLGKTLQAIAIACCFMNEGSILVVCPAILRYSWAEELERWLPFCLPGDIHLVFSRQNNPSYLTRCPRVVVISYTMLHHLQKSMLEQDWAVLIVDESHHVRSTKKKSEPEETKTVIDVAAKVKRIVLLSGTPSLSRPFDIFHQINMLWSGLLGTNKFEFAKTYCDVKYVQGSQGKIFQDFSKGIRLEELHVLLIQTVMIRRLKEQVLVQLPPKRRQIISLVLKRSDIISIDAAIKVENSENACKDVPLENLDEPSGKPSAVQLVGIAKLPGFREWLSIHPIIAGSDGAESLDMNPSSQKMIIFAHHHKVLDGVQEFICEKGIGFVRIDGRTSARDRKLALSSFQSSAEVKIAIIGIRAGGSGLDLSIAQNVVFLELPRSPADMSQAEDRAHRRGQTKAVNIYIFCAKDTQDESHWQYLNKSLCRVSSTTDGRNAIQEIEVEDVSFIDMSNKTYGNDESWVLNSLGYNEVTAEQMKLSHAGLDQAIDNEVAEKDKSEGNVSEVQIGSPRRVSSCRVDEDINERGQEADESCLSQVDSLRFEVSQYTGRIHLYSCIPGTDLRPRPLFENFRPEEIESLNSGGAISDKIRENPAHRQSILAFINEWNNLRSIEQKKLIGKPLQLPLTVELLCLSESNNHGSEGLLKWGSKRRHTPLNELSHPLPSDAVLRDISLCSRNGKKEKVYTQGWSLTNEPLCKYCQAPCESKNAKTPAYFEDLFCTFDCYEEYRMRTSDRFLRQELFQLEHGVCTNCKLDCHKLVEHLKPLSLPRRLEYIVKVAPKVTKQKNLLGKLINDPIEGNAWHADHIVPVYQGGGECKVENMRTLCVACHSDFTAAQCADRSSTRAEAKKKLKVIMSKLKNSQNLEGKHANSEGQGQLEMEENIAEDEFLIKVPGSAYSGGFNIGSRSHALEKSAKAQ